MVYKKDYLHLQNLTSNEETNSNWSKVDDPGGHLEVIIMVILLFVIIISALMMLMIIILLMA